MVFLSRAQLFFKIVLQTTLVEKYGVNDRPKCHGFAREDIQDYWWKDDFQGDFARYPLILLLIQVHVHQQSWDQQKIISIKIASIKIANINCQTELLPPIHNKCWGLSSSVRVHVMASISLENFAMSMLANSMQHDMYAMLSRQTF
jgi:hypothetical protein